MTDIQHPPIESESIEGKVFVGGLSWQTSEEGLRYYFEKFGELSDVAIMSDKRTGQPRGFGFVVLKDSAAVDIVLGQTHNIDGRVVDVKRAVPRDKAPAPSRQESRKIFVGGLPPEVGEKEFSEYFSKFGPIQDSIVMYDRKTNRSRGFGFVTFEDEESIQAVLRQDHEIMNKWVEIKRAEPREPNKPMGGMVGGRMDARMNGDMRNMNGGRRFDDYGGHNYMNANVNPNLHSNVTSGGHVNATAVNVNGYGMNMHHPMGQTMGGRGHVVGPGGVNAYGVSYPNTVRYGDGSGADYGAAGAVSGGMNAGGRNVNVNQYGGGYGYPNANMQYFAGGGGYQSYGGGQYQNVNRDDVGEGTQYATGNVNASGRGGDRGMNNGAAVAGYGPQRGMGGVSMYQYAGSTVSGYGSAYGASAVYQQGGMVTNQPAMGNKSDPNYEAKGGGGGGQYSNGYRSNNQQQNPNANAGTGRVDRTYHAY